jgi:uncharacterized LabA/DUF88 family protein
MFTTVFIDGAYLDKIMRNDFGGAQIDYELLVNEITKNKNLLRTYYYHCPPYVSPERTNEELKRLENKKRFFNALSNLDRFKVCLGELAFRGVTSDGNLIFKQKLIDVMMAVQMIQLAASPKVSEIILIAGDSDFTPAIRAIQDFGVSTTLIHGPLNGSVRCYGLWELCDKKQEIKMNLVNSVLK